MLVFYGAGAFVGLGMTGGIWVPCGDVDGPGLTGSFWLPNGNVVWVPSSLNTT